MIRCPQLSTCILTISLLCAVPLSPHLFPEKPNKQPPIFSSEEPKQQVQYDRLVSFLAEHYKRPRSQVEAIVDETVVHAQSKDIDPLLFLALISVESNFNPNAVSPKGAVGLVQVMPVYHKKKIQAIQKSGKKPTDIRENIKMGLSILSEYRSLHKGDMRKALLSYNGSLRDKKGRYASKIMAEHRRFEGLSSPEPLKAVSVVAANE